MAAPTRGWPVPAALLGLSAIPLVAGTLRLVEVAGGPATLPANDRFGAFPLPLVLHIGGALVYALVGLLQFHPGIRHRRLDWHRRAGRVVAGAGLLVAGSALWMTLFHEAQPGTGALLVAFRVGAGTAMVACLVLGLDAIRQRDVVSHRAWMARAFALGLAAGTQAFTEGLGDVLLGTGVVAGDVAKGSAWAINLAVVELSLRRPAKAARLQPARVLP